jgi:hypothetical protein
MDLIGILPGVIAFGVSFPFDQVLQGFVSPPGPMGMYLFHFIFFFSINQIGWRSGEIWSVCLCFSVGGDQIDVENRVDVPLWG